MSVQKTEAASAVLTTDGTVHVRYANGLGFEMTRTVLSVCSPKLSAFP